MTHDEIWNQKSKSTPMPTSYSMRLYSLSRPSFVVANSSISVYLCNRIANVGYAGLNKVNSPLTDQWSWWQIPIFPQWGLFLIFIIETAKLAVYVFSFVV